MPSPLIVRPRLSSIFILELANGLPFSAPHETKRVFSLISCWNTRSSGRTWTSAVTMAFSDSERISKSWSCLKKNIKFIWPSALTPQVNLAWSYWSVVDSMRRRATLHPSRSSLCSSSAFCSQSPYQCLGPLVPSAFTIISSASEVCSYKEFKKSTTECRIEVWAIKTTLLS